MLPSDIPNLELWLKADAITGLNDGDNIATWNDSSGNGRNATATGVGVARPTYRATTGPDSLPCVEFDGAAGEWFTLPDFLTSYTAGEAFVVLKINNDPPSLGSLSSHPLGQWGMGGASHLPFTDGNIYDSFGTTIRKSAGNPSASLTSWRLYNVYSAASDWQAFVDQTSIFSTASNTIGWTIAPLIGKDTNYIDGKIAEIFFFSRKVTTEERTSMRNYVATKCNLPDVGVVTRITLSTTSGVFVLTGNAVNMSFVPLKPSALIRVFGR